MIAVCCHGLRPLNHTLRLDNDAGDAGDRQTVVLADQPTSPSCSACQVYPHLRPTRPERLRRESELWAIATPGENGRSTIGTSSWLGRLLPSSSPRLLFFCSDSARKLSRIIVFLPHQIASRLRATTTWQLVIGDAGDRLEAGISFS